MRWILNGRVAVLARSAATMRSSSSRRLHTPRKAGPPFTHWSLRKPAAYCEGDPARRVRVGRERLRRIPHHKASPPASRIGVSPSTSSGRCRSVPATAPVGPLGAGPIGCCPSTGARTASATSMAATAWAMTCCGAHPHAQRRRSHSGRAEVHPIRLPRRPPIYVILATCRPTRPPRFAPGRTRTRSSCAGTRPTSPGQSHRGSARAATQLRDGQLQPSQAPCRPAGCRPTCAGATPTPATLRCWPPSGANAPASAARNNAVGDDSPTKPPDQPGERSCHRIKDDDVRGPLSATRQIRSLF